MNAFVDTNILVRHLTGDPPDMAARAKPYLGRENDLLLTDLAAADIGTSESVVCVDLALVLRAAEAYESERIDFADAYLVACAESTGVGTIASFDRSLDRVPGIERIEPPAT